MIVPQMISSYYVELMCFFMVSTSTIIATFSQLKARQPHQLLLKHYTLYEIIQYWILTLSHQDPDPMRRALNPSDYNQPGRAQHLWRK